MDLRAQSTAHTAQEVGLYRAFAVMRSLLNPVPCSVEEASRFQQEEIIEIKKVRACRAWTGRVAPAQHRACSLLTDMLCKFSEADVSALLVPRPVLFCQ